MELLTLLHQIYNVLRALAVVNTIGILITLLLILIACIRKARAYRE